MSRNDTCDFLSLHSISSGAIWNSLSTLLWSAEAFQLVIALSEDSNVSAGSPVDLQWTWSVSETQISTVIHDQNVEIFVITS